jgi:hypothetical protein
VPQSCGLCSWVIPRWPAGVVARRFVMNSADVADAMERTRERIDESRELMAASPEPLFAESPRRWNRAGSGIVGLLAFAGRNRRRIC